MKIRKTLLGIVILASSMYIASEAVDATDTLTLTGSMNTSRQQHTATLLPDGRVIVIGGFDGSTDTNTAEIFDVDTGLWTTTGSMAQARRDHTATLLNNGKILVVENRTAELYDPNTGMFSSAGNTVYNHFRGSTATELLNGKVLVVGDKCAQTNAEIYDPATGTFIATGNLNTTHSYHTATLLSDGKVLIAAGQGQSAGSRPRTHAVAEVYDPSTGTFTTTNSLNVDRSGHTATLLSDGTVLIAGGTRTTTPGHGITLKPAEIYDPSTGTFTLISDMNNSRICHTATLLRHGTVLLVGQCKNTRGEIYNSTSQTFTETTCAMNNPRGSHTATLLDDGRVLIAGGYIAIGPVTTNTAEVYSALPTASLRAQIPLLHKLNHINPT